MGTCLAIILFLGLILSAAAANESPRNKDLVVALKEMQFANYFSFVMLIKMLNGSIPCNITFLVPKDRMLSNVSVPEKAVPEFLMRHSIPTPLLFDHLEHFPTGSIIPTYEPGFMLRVSNGGRRRFRLNEVRIIHPNICTAGSSIRCHGIDGVLSIPEPGGSIIAPSPSLSCDNASAPRSPPAPGTSPAPPLPKSKSPRKLNVGLLGTMASCLMLLAVEF